MVIRALLTSIPLLFLSCTTHICAQENDREPPASLPMGKDVIKMNTIQRDAISSIDADIPLAPTTVVEQVDIAVFYRIQYRFYLGIDEVIRRIEDMVSYTNQVFEDSDISVQLNLVSIAPALSIPDTQNRGDSEFNPDTNIQTAFQDVTFDTFFGPQSTFESRIIENAGADLYALIDVGFDTESPEFAGIAFLNGPLSVSFDFGERARRTIFAHEIGHNFGGGHEIEDDPESTRDNHATRCNNLQTVLFSSVSPASTETFSNPDIQRGNDFCGELNAADNARNINAMAPRVMRFRNAPEPTSSVSLTQAAYVVNEAEGELVVNLSRSGNLASSMTVSVRLSGESAQADIDFFDDFQTITFNPNQNLASVVFPIVSDAVPESTETARIDLLFPLGGDVAQSSATVTINNGSNGTSGNVELSIDRSITNESDPANVRLNRVGGSDGELLVKLELVPADTDQQNNDFPAVLPEEMNRSLLFVLFEDGETEKQFALSAIDDELEEPSELMQARLFIGTTLNARRTVLVADNDTINEGNNGALSIAPLQETEFNNTRRNLPVTITRESGLASRAVAVLAVEGDGVAVVDNTFFATFAEQQSSAVITIPINDTPISENLRIDLSLSSPDSPIAQANASFTLLADEQANTPPAPPAPPQPTPPPQTPPPQTPPETGNNDAGGGALDFVFFILLLPLLIIRTQRE
jgi:hypothetical protein